MTTVDESATPYARRMFADDLASRALGIEIVDLGPAMQPRR